VYFHPVPAVVLFIFVIYLEFFRNYMGRLLLETKKSQRFQADGKNLLLTVAGKEHNLSVNEYAMVRIFLKNRKIRRCAGSFCYIFFVISVGWMYDSWGRFCLVRNMLYIM